MRNVISFKRSNAKLLSHNKSRVHLWVTHILQLCLCKKLLMAGEKSRVKIFVQQLVCMTGLGMMRTPIFGQNETCLKNFTQPQYFDYKTNKQTLRAAEPPFQIITTFETFVCSKGAITNFPCRLSLISKYPQNKYFASQSKS